MYCAMYCEIKDAFYNCLLPGAVSSLKYIKSHHAPDRRRQKEYLTLPLFVTQLNADAYDLVGPSLANYGQWWDSSHQ